MSKICLQTYFAGFFSKTHLNRDSPKIYLWLLFLTDDFTDCWKSDLSGLNQHPQSDLSSLMTQPILGSPKTIWALLARAENCFQVATTSAATSQDCFQILRFGAPFLAPHFFAISAHPTHQSYLTFRVCQKQDLVFDLTPYCLLLLLPHACLSIQPNSTRFSLALMSVRCPNLPPHSVWLSFTETWADFRCWGLAGNQKWWVF